MNYRQKTFRFLFNIIHYSFEVHTCVLLGNCEQSRRDTFLYPNELLIFCTRSHEMFTASAISSTLLSDRLTLYRAFTTISEMLSSFGHLDELHQKRLYDHVWIELSNILWLLMKVQSPDNFGELRHCSSFSYIVVKSQNFFYWNGCHLTN